MGNAQARFRWHHPKFEVISDTMVKCNSMTIRLVAFGENQIGDFIGASYYEKSIQVKGNSMGGIGGMNEFKLTSAQSACLDAGSFQISAETSCPTGQTQLFVGSLSNGKLVVDNKTGSVDVHAMSKTLTEGILKNIGESVRVVYDLTGSSKHFEECGFFVSSDGQKVMNTPMKCWAPDTSTTDGVELISLTSSGYN